MLIKLSLLIMWSILNTWHIIDTYLLCSLIAIPTAIMIGRYLQRRIWK
jgi:hypothetical protein